MEEVTCIRHLLDSASHGNAIIAELLRLKDNIPSVFRLETKQDQLKYAEIVQDFTYFNNSEAVEKKIASNPVLADLDEEFKESNLQIVTRFYSAFESVYQYVVDLNNFLEQLSEGHFIQQTIDTILRDGEGKQLLCENLYLYGCMLLVCEAYIPGNIRERILVAYQRTAVSHHQTNVDSVCKLLRDTGYRNTPGAKRPANYPDELFKRVSIQDEFLKIIIDRLRNEDIYNQIRIYPSPDHRSVALATQASMLVVCLFFSTDMLTLESSKMREVVDKYFPDNWVVPLYMGITLNLIEVWDPYKAAKSALANTINSKNVKEKSTKHVEQLQKLHGQIEKLISVAPKDEKLFDNVDKVLSIIRDANVTLRWLMIHTIPSVFCDSNKKCRQVRDQVLSDTKFQQMSLFNMLLDLSLLELRIKEILRSTLTNKEAKWAEQQREASERIKDLSEVFSGAKPLPRVAKIEGLDNWFQVIGKQIDSLDKNDVNSSTKKIIQLIQALEVVQEFHQLDDIMQVKQWLDEARGNLKEMVRGGDLTEESLVALEVCTDLSYGWYAARTFIDLGREALQKDPAVVSHMRAIFLKLASALEIPLLRINQASSYDLLSVSQYYSNELVKYVKQVLQVIPETVFSFLEKIIDLQTSVIKELPTKVDKDKLKDYSQLDKRMEVAKLTHSVSIFTSGILKMRSTLVGVICIDPKQLLEDGIRYEVSKLVDGRLKHSLCNNGDGSLSNRLNQLAHHMDGYRRSFEYIQDYVNIHGLKIWQEEVSKIIHQSIEEECAKVLRLKSPQNTASILTKGSNNIFSCLLQDICLLTHPKSTIYVDRTTSWYDCKTHQETASMSIFALMYRGIGAAGLRSLARLAESCVSIRLNHLSSTLDGLPSLQFNASNPKLPIANPAKFYSQLVSRVVGKMAQIVDWALDVGMAQLILKHVNYQLNTLCKFDAMHLESSLRAVNEAIVHDTKDELGEKSKYYEDLLPDLIEMMHSVGITNPYRTIYISTTGNDQIAQIVFAIAISQLPKFDYVQFAGTLTGKQSSNHIDGTPFIIGLITLLNQYHQYALLRFVLLLCQYIISHVDNGINSKNADFPPEAHIAIKFLESVCRIAKIPQTLIETNIPANILCQYQFMASKTV